MLGHKQFLPAQTQHRRDALTLQKRDTGPGNSIAGMQTCMNQEQRHCMLLTVSQSTPRGLLFSLLVFARSELCFLCFLLVVFGYVHSTYCVCCCLTTCMLCLLLLSNEELLSSMKPTALSSLSFIPSMFKQKKLELLV